METHVEYQGRGVAFWEQIGRDDNNSAHLIASSDMILDPGLGSTVYFYSSNLLQKPYNSFH